MILAGVDEAGYGPILGPLCTGLSAFRAAGAGDPGEAEAALRRALRRAGRGVRVGDSKAIHRPSAGIGPLERPFLAVLAARDGRVPRTGLRLLEALGAGEPPADHPWYGGLRDLPLPLAADAGEAEERGANLAAALGEEGVALLRVGASALPEGRYNGALDRRGSKAAVLFGEVAARFADAREAAPRGEIHLVCDRQGARVRYGPILQAEFPGLLVQVRGEGARSSSYVLAGEGGGLRLRFEVGADSLWTPVGLASMAAKYLREVHMAALNAWILREAPGVRRTAGYWTDGLRFLAETAGARRRLGVDDGVFVRRR